MKFIITGLPRTRSAWFAAYFTACGYPCYHEATRTGVELKDGEGTADSGVLLFPRWLEKIGEHKKVLIHRDPTNVAISLQRMGVIPPMATMVKYAHELKGVDGLHVNFEDINDRLEEIHEYLDIPFDEQKADILTNMKIESLYWSK